MEHRRHLSDSGSANAVDAARGSRIDDYDDLISKAIQPSAVDAPQKSMNSPSLLFSPWSLILIVFAAVSSLLGRPEQTLAERVSDRVRLVRGTENGEVTNMTPLEVTVDKGLPGSRAIAVNQIKSIQFDGEPAELTQARVHAGNGAFAKALQALERIDAGQLRRDFIKQDVEFYKAYCAARLALSGEGQIIEAGKQLNLFVRNHPDNFHYLDASSVMGDLLMADGRFEFAEKQYAELAKAPWPDYKMRAAVSVGRSLQAQHKHADAIRQFDSALAMPDDGADPQNQKLSATLGKAVSLAETGKVEDAVGSIQKVIQDADPQQKELYARAYNALGTCHEKAKQIKEALHAFLHVDVLYSNVPEAHAEALAHLVPLWKAVGQEERSRQARDLLQQRYAGSKWAKQVQ
jgi:tetratricopeptide (TPR) repeat protein